MIDLTRPQTFLERRPGVELRIADRTFEVVGFAPSQLVVRGPMPLPEETLLEVTGGAPAPFHARVLACWDEGERFGAVLAPFALSGRALRDWRGLATPRGDA